MADSLLSSVILSRFWLTAQNFDTIEGSSRGGQAVLVVNPPERSVGLSLHEFYALWAEDLRRALASRLRRDGLTAPTKRYIRNLEVLEFMRATWDALLTAYQQERIWNLTRYHYSSTLNSATLQGIGRFRNQLVYHPLEAAQRLKRCAQACRAWYFGSTKPTGRLLVFKERRVALLASYIARALPPSPPDASGLEGLLKRLTSEPPPEPAYWRPFVKAYVQRWAPFRAPRELYTMPSAHAALGFPRSSGGHVAGVQYIVLLGYALRRRESRTLPPSGQEDFDGSYLELLSQALNPKPGDKEPDIWLRKMFQGRWDHLESTIPGVGEHLQRYLKIGTAYILDRLDYVPILPITAEEKGLKTRFPTASLTAVNLVQQILRRIADHVIIRDPRFSDALGGASPGINLAGECGPWYSQDCTAATDYHPEWLTRGLYEELANKYPKELGPYRRWFTKLFGPKKIVRSPASTYYPNELLQAYPMAPLLCRPDGRSVKEAGYPIGHWRRIISLWDDWLDLLNTETGVITTTGQMMGDPTSFPPLMLVSLCAAEQTLKVYPYTRSECKRWHPRLKRQDPVLKGVGDDGLLPRWTKARVDKYNLVLNELAAELSAPKCFHHPTRGLIAEVPTESGFEVPFWPTSVLVAPPGGSKGQVTWVSQPSSFGGDPTRPTARIPKMFWKLSPYYYMWQLAYNLGLPVAAPVAWGGIGLPIRPKASTVAHMQWLSFLSQADLHQLVIGLGIGPIGSSQNSLLDSSASDWVRKVIDTNKELSSAGMDLLSPCMLSDDAEVRTSFKDAYQLSVSRLRSVEFYFRTPPEALELSAPSVRMSSQRFVRKVYSVPLVKTKGYAETNRDLERKMSLFFVRSAGFLPDPSAPPTGHYGLESSTEVKLRWKAPWLRGVG